MARLRTIPSVHERTLPRAASKRAPLRQTERNASWVTSSAIAESPTIRCAAVRPGTAVTVVQDGERVGVVALDERHQIVGESL